MNKIKEKILKDVGYKKAVNEEALSKVDEESREEQYRKDKIKSRTIAGKW